jgi:hypothetical protein
MDAAVPLRHAATGLPPRPLHREYRTRGLGTSRHHGRSPRCDGVELLWLAADQDGVRAERRQLMGDAAADSRSAAGDDDHLP